MTRRINCWSGPRNVSTALMYSFRQRADTRVVDEPLYGPYLATTRAPQPARDELIRVLDTDAARIIDHVVLGPCDRDVLFMKQMAHHLTDDIDTSFLEECDNVLLLRDPAEVLASLVNQIAEPTDRDLGLARQVALHRELHQMGQEPPVLDSRELLLDPEGVLRQLCDRLGISWDPAMLSWPAGPKPEDGIWAEHWYDNVHRSTGFAPYLPRSGQVPDHCEDLLERSRPLYDELFQHAIRAGS